MNTPLVRKGGNLDSTYNWLLDSFDHGFDYFFESSPDSGGNGSVADSFVNRIQSGGGQPMLTIPMLKYVATNGYSFSVSKYRPYGYVPVATAPENSDIGNGVTGTNADSGRNLYFTGNDPTDANTANSTGFQQSWVQHLIVQHNTATNGGVPYYILDNEPDDWFDEHADVDPGGVKLADLQSRLISYSAMVKGVDSSALTVGPEISGWYSYFYSGYDLCQGAQYDNYNFTDYNSYGTDPNTGSTYNFLPKLLADLKSNDSGKAHQTLDVFTVHYYPQQNEYSDDVSSATQSERNVSTRSLWDPTYQDASFIGSSGLNDGAGDGHVNLLPTLRAWATTYYGSGLQTGLTEYSWGADGDMSGATAQADILGIFGRGITTNGKTNPGIDLATRFTSPASGTPVYKVFQMYRNYDGAKSTFGNISVSCTSSSNPNTLSAFASHTLNATFTGHDVTVMVVNKQLSATQAINISSTLLPYCYIPTGETATVYQLAAVNGVSSNAAITKLASIPVSSQALTATVAAQSVTLFKYHVNYVWNHVFHLTLASAALQKLLAAQMANRLSTQKVSVKFVNTATGALTDETDGIYSDNQGNVYVGTSANGTFDIVVKPAGGLSQTFHAVCHRHGRDNSRSWHHEPSSGRRQRRQRRRHHRLQRRARRLRHELHAGRLQHHV